MTDEKLIKQLQEDADYQYDYVDRPQDRKYGVLDTQCAPGQEQIIKKL